MRKWLATGTMVLAMAAVSVPLRAQTKDDQEDLRTTVEALKQRIKDQDRRIVELENRQTVPAAQTTQGVQKDAIREVLAEMKAESDKAKPALPTWLDGLKFAGDFRLRYEYNGSNWGKTEDSEKKDRSRARYRLRFGATKNWLNDQPEVGFRLASGENNDPTSTNQSFTQDFSKKPVWIDLAYAKYTPKDLKGFSITGGKMIKPWVENEIFWLSFNSAGEFVPACGFNTLTDNGLRRDNGLTHPATRSTGESIVVGTLPGHPFQPLFPGPWCS